MCITERILGLWNKHILNQLYFNLKMLHFQKKILAVYKKKIQRIATLNPAWYHSFIGKVALIVIILLIWLWCWRRLLRVPWTARRSNQSILKEISPEYSLEGLMLKLQYFGHLMRRTDSLEKTPDAGKDWGQEEKGTTDGWMASPSQWTWVWASSRHWGWTGKPGVLQSMGSQRVGHDWATELNMATNILVIISIFKK